MEKLAPEDKVYRSLGRMFVVSDKTDIITQLGKDKEAIVLEGDRLKVLREGCNQKKDHFIGQLTKAITPA